MDNNQNQTNSEALEKLPLVELAREALSRGNALKAVELLEEEIKKLLEQNKVLAEQNNGSEVKIDSLTGLFNKNMFLETLYPAYMYSLKTKQPLGQIAFDIHGLKQINEQQGWDAGNKYLTKIGTLIRKVIGENLNKSVMAFRPGGDEMVVLLPNTGAGEVKATEKIFLDAFDHEGIKVAVGSGVIDTTDFNSMIESNNQIDKVLYASKVETHSSQEGESNDINKVSTSTE